MLTTFEQRRPIQKEEKQQKEFNYVFEDNGNFIA